MSAGIQIPEAALAALEQALNRVIALDPEGARRLSAMQGRVILIELEGFGTRVYLIPGTSELQVFGSYAAEPDCTLRGTPVALARMGLSKQRTDSLFAGEVTVEGDTGLAQQFGDIMLALDIDWEEQLARLTGDSFAHQLGNLARSACGWGLRSADSVAQTAKEYLQEEGRLVPTDYEVRELIAEVDTLRDDVERLAARIDRIARRRA